MKNNKQSKCIKETFSIMLIVEGVFHLGSKSDMTLLPFASNFSQAIIKWCKLNNSYLIIENVQL